ncbi:MAG: PLP-dependent transferase [Propionibacteriales bacterium]|uniref:Uncharacterized protein n=1 Tax=Janibacter limosus TaxID=53458 RepID=A0A4P6MWR7_9MICO|nr:PLP-dependent transferase [Janibacter limosus]MDN5726308.1 PLP-dependent transferase [Propionibacteriales bacterium]QBF47472.1 hypothetical protein EXU32_15165 [Janibacter limosus]
MSAPATTAQATSPGDGGDGTLMVGVTVTEALALSALAMSNRGGRVVVSASIAGASDLADYLLRHDRPTSMVDATNLEDVGGQVDELTQVVVLDSITDQGALVDIAAFAELCHSHDLVLVIDNSRLSSRVLEATDLGATLSVSARGDGTQPLTEIEGTTFATSLLLRLAHQAQLDVAINAARADWSQGTPVDLDAIASLPDVAKVSPLDWSESYWASEIHSNLDDLAVVTLRSERVLPAATSDVRGLTQLTPTTVLLHRSWIGAEWPAAAIATLASTERTPGQQRISARIQDFDTDRDLPVENSRRHARELVDAQPWACMWTSRLEVTGQGDEVTARTLPSIWASTRIVRPFAIPASSRDAVTGHTDLVTRALQAEVILSDRDRPGVVSATVTAGLPLRVSMVGATGATELQLPILPAQDRAALVAAQLSATVLSHQPLDGGLVIDQPWQEGGLDRGPDPGELLLLSLGLDLGRALASVTDDPWSILIEARRDLRTDAQSCALSNAVAYLSLDDHDVVDPDRVARACFTAPTYQLLATS